MAFRIERALVRGEISNEVRGIVTGQVWLLGRKAPVILALRGNCLRDLAGCRLTFENPRPESDSRLDALSDDQNGFVGDMTASRKVRIPPGSEVEPSEPPVGNEAVAERLANALYLEWFSKENGRVVIESVDWRLEISAAKWSMDPAGESNQIESNRHQFQEFLESITGESDDGDLPIPTPTDEALDAEEFDAESEDGTPLDDELDEFEWEQELREADRHAEAYHEAFDKYKDDPDRERLIAEALGWDDGPADDDMEASEVDEEDPTIREAIEVFEGVVHHPLSKRAMDFALDIQREAEDLGLLGNSSKSRQGPILDLILNVVSLGGKLAGALDGWHDGVNREPGFVIAMLKRAQLPLNEALDAFNAIRPDPASLAVRHWLHSRKRDLFDLRKDIVDLMHELRTGA